MELAERERLIEMYAEGVNAVLDALSGIDGVGWEAREAPGEWCPREVVHHLGDSEMYAAIRIRMIIAGENPTIQGYNEMDWARRLHYDLPIAPSLAAFQAARAATVPLLRALGDAEWARPGTHSEFGTFGATGWLAAYSSHAHDHAEQIRRARAHG
jgi:DinB superfamily